MAKPRTPRPLTLPPILPGPWQGEIVGTGSVSFGQEVQPGPPRQAVELTYTILAVRLIGPGSPFRWPGVLAIFAPTPLKPDRPDAGTLMRNGVLPVLHLSLDVARVQFSDMLPWLSAGRLRGFHLTVEDGQDGCWPIRSWGMSTLPPDAKRTDTRGG